MNPIFDTIVVGAGWSGVVAAQNLNLKGYSVLVLEARDRIGGRARTHVSDMHAPVDLGCSWIHGYKEGNPTKYIAKELGVTVNLPKPTQSVIYGEGGPLPSDVSSNLQSSLSSARTHAYLDSQTNIPAPDASASLADHFFGPYSALSTSSSPSQAKNFARSIEIPFGAPLEDLSLRWAGWENSLAGSDAAPESGFQPLVEKLMNKAIYNGTEIRLNEVVESIFKEADGVVVCASSGQFRARTVLCTIPLGVLKTGSLTFTPSFPARRLEVISRTHVGALEKIVLAYPEAWWPDAATVGSFTFLPVQKHNSPTQEDTPLSILQSHTISVASFAAPSLPSPHSTLLLYISSTPARRLARFSDDEVTQAAHEFLICRFKPSNPTPSPLGQVRTNWLEEPYSRGATTTPSIVGKGRSPLDFMELGKPLWEGRLGFAGEHTEPNHRGSISGAVFSGEREALRIDRLLKFLDEKD